MKARLAALSMISTHIRIVIAPRFHSTPNDAHA